MHDERVGGSCTKIWARLMDAWMGGWAGSSACACLRRALPGCYRVVFLVLWGPTALPGVLYPCLMLPTLGVRLPCLPRRLHLGRCRLSVHRKVGGLGAAAAGGCMLARSPCLMQADSYLLWSQRLPTFPFACLPAHPHVLLPANCTAWHCPKLRCDECHSQPRCIPNCIQPSHPLQQAIVLWGGAAALAGR